MYQRGGDSPCFPVVRISNPQANDTLLWNPTQQLFVNEQAITPSPGTVGVITDSTMTGNGTTSNPLHVVPPAAGTVAVVTDTTLTGNGTTGSPLHVVTPTYSTVTDISLLMSQSISNNGNVILSTDTLAGHGTLNSGFNNIDGYNINSVWHAGVWTCPIAGMYHYDVSIIWAVNATGIRGLQTYLTNTLTSDFNINSNWVPAFGTFPTTNHVSGTIYMNVGDTLFWDAYQNSGAALNANFVLMSVTFTGHN